VPCTFRAHSDTPKPEVLGFCYCSRHHFLMARHPAQGGRPSKGDRALLLTRPPIELAQAVRAEAERQNLSYSDYIANVLAAAHGFPPVVESKDSQQMQLIA